MAPYVLPEANPRLHPLVDARRRLSLLRHTIPLSFVHLSDPLRSYCTDGLNRLIQSVAAPEPAYLECDRVECVGTAKSFTLCKGTQDTNYGWIGRWVRKVSRRERCS